MNVIEIFSSIDGEGRRQGLLSTFVRLYDCNVRCSYCDTTYSYGVDADVQHMTVQEVADAIEALGNYNVTITGGEPLLQEDEIAALVEELNARCLTRESKDNEMRTGARLYQFGIETNGTLVPHMDYDNVFYSFDYKCPSSLVEDQMDMGIFSMMTAKDSLKFVVGTEEDLETMHHIVTKYELPCPAFVQPVWGQIDPVRIVDYLKKYHLDQVRLQLQIHKFIWDPEAKGV